MADIPSDEMRRVNGGVEFINLGNALEVRSAATATVTSEDDGETLVLTWPNDGPTLYFDRRYAGVRLFTDLLMEEAGLTPPTPLR